MAFKASVIIPAYNQPWYLHHVLTSAAVQTEREFEVLIADDGSEEQGAKNLAVIERCRQRFGLKIRHLWHEDAGFRKTVIQNKAVAQADAEVLIFNDGDCVMHPEFVREHLAHLGRGSYCVGRTPRLGQKFSHTISQQQLEERTFQRVNWRMVLDGLFGDSRKVEFGFYLRDALSFWLASSRKRTTDLWGGNFSCFRDDFIAVNGFNEEFVGWGQEDSELGVRLSNFGLERKLVANRAINFHLWHPVPPGRPERYVNHERKLKVIEQGLSRCEQGIDKHLG